MADKTPETRPENSGNAAEAMARQAGQAARSGVPGAGGQTAADPGPRGAAPGGRRAGEAGGEMLRHSADAGADSMRHLGSVAGAAMQRDGEAAADGQRNLAHSAAAQLEDMGTRMALAAQESAHDLRALFAVPVASRDGMQDMRAGVSGLVDGVLRTNMRMVQELFRLANPANTFELQRRFGAEYLDTMLHGSTMLLRAARRTADDVLRPLEERAGQRRREQHEPKPPHEQHHNRVSDVMQTGVRVANPEDTVEHAAKMMREADAGALAVGEGDRLVGMLTDRDVTVRLVAEGRDPRQTRVREVMTADARYVFDDEDVGHVADNMAEQKVRRLPVVNREKRLVGVISFADLGRQGRGQHGPQTMAAE